MKFKLFEKLEDYQQKYMTRTKKHIDKVCKYGKKLGKDYSKHDSDKLHELFDDYALMMKKDSFGGSDIKDNMSGLTKDEEDRVNKATLKHITKNDHHPEKWAKEKLNSFDRANPKLGLHCESMPNYALEEMCADWCSMSEEFDNTPFEWMNKVIPERWIFTEDQVNYIKDTLSKMWEK